jgi:hypothetical protein
MYFPPSLAEWLRLDVRLVCLCHAWFPPSLRDALSSEVILVSLSHLDVGLVSLCFIMPLCTESMIGGVITGKIPDSSLPWHNSTPLVPNRSQDNPSHILLLSYFLRRVKVKLSHTGLDRPLGLQEVEAPRISRQPAHEGGKVVSSTHRPPLPPSRYPWYSFLLGVGSTPGP